MDKNIVFRTVRPEDAEQFINLVNVVWRDAYKHIFPEEVFVSKERVAKDMVASFSDFNYHRGDHFGYVAECDGKLVGISSGKTISNYPHFAQDYAELMMVYILPEYQGLGIGSKFKDLFVEWAKENGVKRFVIGVLKDNHNARKVYEKWGGKLDRYVQPYEKSGVEYDDLTPDMLPVMVAAVGMEGMDTAEISEYTTNYLIPELESIEGVASASASGLLEESVHVLIREDKIASLNEKIFGVNLHEVGLADLVCQYFEELVAGVGAIRNTLIKYVGE